MRRKVPVSILHKVVKFVGTKKLKGKIRQLKEVVDQCEDIGKSFIHFTAN